MNTTRALLVLALVAGCGDDPMNGDVDSSMASCECPQFTAADITYDNASSGLPGTNVQEAVDDLAARTDPAGDAFARISYAESVFSSSASEELIFSGGCPDGHRVLGGACEGRPTDGAVAETRLLEGAYRCTWTNPTGEIGVELKVLTSCLAPPAN